MIDGRHPPAHPGRTGDRSPAGTLRRPGRPVDADSEETRQGCLEAAMRAFAAQGYAGTSMRAVSHLAGIAPGSLYHHFPSKAVLYRAAYEHALELAYLDYEQAVLGRVTLVGELRAILDRSLEIMHQRPWITRLALRATVDVTHPELDGGPFREPERVRRFFDSLLARAVARDEIDQADRATLKEFVGVLLWGISSVGIRSPDAAVVAVEGAKRAIENRLLRSRRH